MTNRNKRLLAIFLTIYILGSLIGGYWIANQSFSSSLSRPRVYLDSVRIPSQRFQTHRFLLANDIAVLYVPKETSNLEENTLVFYDVSDYENPIYVSQIIIPFPVTKIVGKQNSIYAISFRTLGETRIELIDLSDPLFPSVIGIVKILDKVVGVIDQTYSFSILLETGLVMTFSKDTLQKTGEFILPNISSPITEYAYKNSTLIVMDNLGLHIFTENASNQFDHVGFIYTNSISVIRTFALMGNYIYFANQTDAIHVFNISNPDNVDATVLDTNMSVDTVAEIQPINSSAFALVVNYSEVLLISHINHTIVQNTALVAKFEGNGRFEVEANNQAIFLSYTSNGYGVQIFPSSSDFSNPASEIPAEIQDIIAAQKIGNSIFLVRAQKFEVLSLSTNTTYGLKSLVLSQSANLSQNFAYAKKAILYGALLLVLFNTSLKLIYVDLANLRLTPLTTFENTEDFKVSNGILFIKDTRLPTTIALYRLIQEQSEIPILSRIEYLDYVTFVSPIRYFDGNQFKLVVLKDNSIQVFQLVADEEKPYLSDPVTIDIPVNKISVFPYIPFTLYYENIVTFYLANESGNSPELAFRDVYSVEKNQVILKERVAVETVEGDGKYIELPVAAFLFGYVSAFLMQSASDSYSVISHWSDILSDRGTKTAITLLNPLIHYRYFFEPGLYLTSRSEALIISWAVRTTFFGSYVNTYTIILTVFLIANLPFFVFFSVKYLRNRYKKKKQKRVHKIQEHYEL